MRQPSLLELSPFARGVHLLREMLQPAQWNSLMRRSFFIESSKRRKITYFFPFSEGRIMRTALAPYPHTTALCVQDIDNLTLPDKIAAKLLVLRSDSRHFNAVANHNVYRYIGTECDYVRWKVHELSSGQFPAVYLLRAVVRGGPCVLHDEELVRHLLAQQVELFQHEQENSRPLSIMYQTMTLVAHVHPDGPDHCVRILQDATGRQVHEQRIPLPMHRYLGVAFDPWGSLHVVQTELQRTLFQFLLRGEVHLFQSSLSTWRASQTIPWPQLTRSQNQPGSVAISLVSYMS